MFKIPEKYHHLSIAVRVIFALAFFVILSIDHTKNGPLAEKVEQNLLKDFNTIPPMPNALFVKKSHWSKPHNACVEALYDTSASFQEIKTYYESQLLPIGWSPIPVRSTKVWGRELRDFYQSYRNGDREATIEYAKDPAQTGWTFSFALTWHS